MQGITNATLVKPTIYAAPLLSILLMGMIIISLIKKCSTTNPVPQYSKIKN